MNPLSTLLHAARRMAIAWWLLLAVLLFCAATPAFAARNINFVTINGTATDTVLPGDSITIRVNATISGGSRWRSTRIETVPASSLSVCRVEPDFNFSGTYNQYFTLDAPDTNGVHDLVITLYDNPNCNGGSTQETFPGALTTDNTFPVVLSIERTDPSPTNDPQVHWTVTFDRPVTGVTGPDFLLIPGGGLGGSISGWLSGSGAVYYVVSSTGSGSGTLGLNVVDNDSITGANGLRLGGAGAGNGDFTGQVYIIDRLAPTIPSASIASNNAISPAYARVGDTVTVTFTTSDANGVATPVVTIGGVAATVSGAGNNWTASRVMTNTDTEGLVAFTINVSDLAGNAAIPRTTVTDGTSVTFDRSVPVAVIACQSPALCGPSNPTSASQVTWSVSFSEPVSGVSAANFTLSGAGTITAVSGSGANYSVTANTAGAGTLGLNFNANLHLVHDLVGNNPLATLAVSGNTYTIEGCAAGACTFNVVESGAAAGTPIFTRRVGATVSLDILAMNGAAIHTTSTAVVSATLVVASNDASCGTVAVSNTVAATFTGAAAGRMPVTFTPTRAARDVRVRVDSNGSTYCSLDNFAVRPDAFAVSGSANADPTGVSAGAASAGPVFKAGSAPFSLSAASFAGYDGTPSINAGKVQAVTGTAGVLSGSLGGAAPASGTASGAAFTYSEVGYFRLGVFAVYDDGAFAAVDSAKSPAECFAPSTPLAGAGTPQDPNLADGTGRIGCYFGSAQSAYFGRFIPDHFALSAGTVANRSALAACTSNFTYMGEAMTPSFTLTAQNAANTTTVNYTGAYARLDIPTQLGRAAIDDPAAPGVRTPVPVCGATPAHPCMTLAAASGSFVNGVATGIEAPLTVYRRPAAAAPFTAFKAAIAPVDADGVKLAAYNLDATNVVAAAADHGLVGATAVRHGRMNIDNAYGSELLNLSMRITAQYWTGTGYATNTLDNCTPLTAGDFSMDEQSGGITAANMNIANLAGGAPMAAGAGRIVLSKPAPTPASKGKVRLNSSRASLPGNGRATFGVYKAGPVIYVRETY